MKGCPDCARHERARTRGYQGLARELLETIARVAVQSEHAFGVGSEAESFAWRALAMRLDALGAESRQRFGVSIAGILIVAREEARAARRAGGSS